jgi:hypothetical protein
VTGITWSPDGSRLTYRVKSQFVEQDRVRVKDLGSSGAVTTIATGDLGNPVWEPDSTHLLLSARVEATLGLENKLFIVNLTSPPPALSAANGMPATDLEPLVAQPSPDGHQVAFLATWSGRTQVWLINADGSGLTQLTVYDAAAFPYSCADLTWTPS